MKKEKQKKMKEKRKERIKQKEKKQKNKVMPSFNCSILLECNTHVSAKDKRGYTPLHILARYVLYFNLELLYCSIFIS